MTVHRTAQTHGPIGEWVASVDAFPAPAGMNLDREDGPQGRTGVPRTRGDEPVTRLTKLTGNARSPHPRG